MKSVIVKLGRYRLIIQRYPTSRKVVPSQLQRDKATVVNKYGYPETPTDRKTYDVVPSLGADKWVGTNVPNRKEEPRYAARYDVHPFFQPKVFGFGGCRHTDEEVREMAHKVHVREQAGLIREAVQNDPAFFGANDPAFEEVL